MSIDVPVFVFVMMCLAIVGMFIGLYRQRITILQYRDMYEYPIDPGHDDNCWDQNERSR